MHIAIAPVKKREATMILKLTRRKFAGRICDEYYAAIFANLSGWYFMYGI